VAAKGNRRVDRRRLGPPVALEALASKGLGCRYVGLGGAARWSRGLPQRQGNHEESDEQRHEAIWRGHRLSARHGIERCSSVGGTPRAELTARSAWPAPEMQAAYSGGNGGASDFGTHTTHRPRPSLNHEIRSEDADRRQRTPR